VAKNSRALAHIRQLCSLGTGSRAAIPAVVKAMHELVDSAHNLFIWTDAAGNPTDRYCEVYFPSVVEAAKQPLPGKTDLAGIAARGQLAGNLRRRDKQFFHSAFYSEVYHPMRARQSLDAVVRIDGVPVGMLVLHRDNDVAFGEAEQRLLESCLPYLRMLWQKPAVTDLDSFMHTDTSNQGVVILSESKRVRYLSASAEQLFCMCGIRVRDDMAQGDEKLIAQICALYQKAEHADAARHGPPSVRINNAWGRFVFRAFSALPRGDAPDHALIGISIERQEPLALAIVRGFAQSSLSPKQRDIALMLALGKTADQVATQLSISATTYRDHVQKIYEKMGVTQRADLIRTLTQPLAA
jgi:DNA-binding CsgD family transcriptional regulator